MPELARLGETAHGGRPVAARPDVEREGLALRGAADGQGVPLVPGHARDPQEDEVARLVLEAIGLAQIEAGHTRAQDARLHDVGARGPPRESNDSLERERSHRHGYPLPEDRAVKHSDHEPRDVESVRRVEYLEPLLRARGSPSEKPHDPEDGEPDHAGEACAGRQLVDHRDPGLSGVVRQVGGRVSESEREHRVSRDGVERDRVVERDDRVQARLADRREQPAHGRQEDERAVEVQACAAPARDLDSHVARPVDAPCVSEEDEVRRGPQHEEHHEWASVLERSNEPGRHRGARFQTLGGVFAHGQPTRAAFLDRSGDLRMAVERLVELVEREPAIVGPIGVPDEKASEAIGDPGADGHVVLRASQRDHPSKLAAIEHAVAVEVVDPEGKAPPGARSAVEETLHAGQKRIGTDGPVGVAAENGDDTQSETTVANAEVSRDRRRVDAPIGARRIAKGRLERLEKLLVGQGKSIDRALFDGAGRELADVRVQRIAPLLVRGRCARPSLSRHGVR